MATGVRFHALAEHLAEGVHNLASNTLKVMLTNTAPNAATHTVKADLTEIAGGNGYTAGGHAVTVTASGQTGGVYKLECNDVVITATGGDIGPFRYEVLYNDTPTSPADPLIMYWDRGESITLKGAEGDSVTLDVNPTNGILQIT